MLKERYKINDVVSVKLASGEELVARFVDDEGGALIIRKPVTIVPHGEGMGFAPFMFTTQEDEFTINTNSVMSIVNTAPELAKQYLETTSGIIT
jgi:hypothetical protein